MPWHEETLMAQKEKFIVLAMQEGANISELCRQFNITRSCAYKWLKRFKEEGIEGLKEKSRAPCQLPNKTSNEIEELILNTRREYPAWGGRKLRKFLENQGFNNLPDPSTITRILHRNQLIEEQESLKRKPFNRFEHPFPNNLWQMDFKGHFAMQTGRCHPLTIIDDHSRFSICLKACLNQQEQTVKEALIEVFRRHGLPERMTMDNGSPWSNGYEIKGFTKLKIWLIHLGIYVTHSRPYHPQTQGKDERFHRTLKEELLIHTQFEDILDAQKRFETWQACYNYMRPHEALEMKVPSDIYQNSPRNYPENLPNIFYDEDFIVRKVQKRGQIEYKGNRYFIGENFYNYPIGLRENSMDGKIDVYFCHQRIKSIEIING